MAHFLSRVAVAPFRALPAPVRRRLVQAITRAAASGRPDDALRELLTMSADLSGQVDLAALAYGDGVHVKHRLMRYHDFFTDRIRADERVLDIGCGYGAVAYSIAGTCNATVIGLDMEASNIAKAQAKFRHPKLTFRVGRAPEAVPAGGADVIVLSNVLEHIEHRVDFLREVQRRSSPARLLIRVPMFNRGWEPPLREELGLFPYGDPTHFTEYTRDSFEAEMADAGFSVRHLQINWGEIWAEVAPARTPAA